jgi:hypothetical protein
MGLSDHPNIFGRIESVYGCNGKADWGFERRAPDIGGLQCERHVLPGFFAYVVHFRHDADSCCDMHARTVADARRDTNRPRQQPTAVAFQRINGFSHNWIMAGITALFIPLGYSV